METMSFTLQNLKFMEPNLSMKESIFRYVIMAALVITGGLLHNIWIMALGVPVFLTGLTGYCAIYQMLGINHSEKEA
jgi:hypothetical protein